MPNISRQGHYADEIGGLKVEAVAAAIRRVNAAARINCLPLDFLAMTDEQIDAALGTTDLFIFATDRFAAQARGNEVALRLNKPAIWIGLYAGGLAGEIVWWAPHIDALFPLSLPNRYAAHAKAAETGRSLDPPSDGCTIFDVSLLDSIAGMLAIGLLTRGSDNRFGRLIDELGDRNFIQVQLDPLGLSTAATSSASNSASLTTARRSSLGTRSSAPIRTSASCRAPIARSSAGTQFDDWHVLKAPVVQEPT